MAWDAILGLLSGGALRLAPMAVDFFSKREERKHELELLRENRESDMQRAKAAKEGRVLEGNITIDTKYLDAYTEAIKAQGQITGNKFWDGVNVSVRPVLTYWWCIVLVTAVMIAKIYALVHAGRPLYDAILGVWGPPEQTIVANIMAFWFLDRVIRYQNGK